MRTEKEIRERLRRINEILDINNNEMEEFTITPIKRRKIMLKQEILEWVLE